MAQVSSGNVVAKSREIRGQVLQYVLRRDVGGVSIEESCKNVKSDAMRVPSAETTHNLSGLSSSDDARLISVDFREGLVYSYNERDEVHEECRRDESEVRNFRGRRLFV